MILGKCAQCLSLLLGGLTLSSSCSQVSLGEQQFMLLSMHKLHLCVRDHLFTGSLGNDSDSLERRGQPIYSMAPH